MVTLMRKKQKVIPPYKSGSLFELVSMSYITLIHTTHCYIYSHNAINTAITHYYIVVQDQQQYETHAKSIQASYSKQMKR